MLFARPHLLGLEGLSAEEIEFLLDSAESFKEVSEREIKKVPALRGRTVVNLFYEASTRTRTSFEIAAKRLSAASIPKRLSFGRQRSSVQRTISSTALPRSRTTTIRSIAIPRSPRPPTLARPLRTACSCSRC